MLYIHMERDTKRDTYTPYYLAIAYVQVSTSHTTAFGPKATYVTRCCAENMKITFRWDNPTICSNRCGANPMPFTKLYQVQDAR